MFLLLSLGQLLFVHSYPYVTNSIEWEIPAGGIDQGESIFEGARREVWEETGYETSNYEFLYTYYPMNGIANKVCHLVRCQATTGSGEFDRNEVKEFKWVSRPEIQQMIAKRVIKDGFSLTGLLLYLTTTSQ